METVVCKKRGYEFCCSKLGVRVICDCVFLWVITVHFRPFVAGDARACSPARTARGGASCPPCAPEIQHRVSAHMHGNTEKQGIKKNQYIFSVKDIHCQ